MNKKIFLTSIIALGFACPAMAESFPSDGSMLENKTYDGAATYDNTGVYDGDVTAQAYYDWDLLSPTAGQYLPQGATAVATCTTGSFCPGATDIHYDNTQDQGITSCSTVGDNSFTSSDVGASANTDCYKACNIANMGANGSIANIAHAATLTGNDYYGSGADTCEPATCVAGWHVKPGLNLSTTIGNRVGESYGYVDNAGTFTESGGSHGQSFYGISGNNTWATYYDSTSGMVTGAGRCSNVSGTGLWNGASSASDITTHTTAELGAEGGQYCYCNVTGYTPAGGTLQSLSSPWLFSNDAYNAAMCTSNCAYNCAFGMREGGQFRAAMLGSVGTSLASCEANTINITWKGATQAAIDANNAGSTVYEGDIRTPSEAESVTGKHFVGWKFLKPSNNNNGNN